MQLPPPKAKHKATNAVVFDYPASWFENSGMSAGDIVQEHYGDSDPQSDDPQPATGAMYLAKRQEALKAAREAELAEIESPEELSEETRANQLAKGLAVGTEIYEAAAAAKRARKEQLQRDKALADEAEAILADSARTASIKARHVERQRTELLALKVYRSFLQDLSKHRQQLHAIRSRKIESRRRQRLHRQDCYPRNQDYQSVQCRTRNERVWVTTLLIDHLISHLISTTSSALVRSIPIPQSASDESYWLKRRTQKICCRPRHGKPSCVG
jgi:hypothetical protein